MKLSEIKQHLSTMQDIKIAKPDGTFVPLHFHITECGLASKHFIDCGGTVRTEHSAVFQIWVAEDIDHRLLPEKILGIIEKAHVLFEGRDPEVEIEFQTETVGRYRLGLRDTMFELFPMQTDCLAKEVCGVPAIKKKVSLAELSKPKNVCCTPGEKCC
jgi:hypothetical protein